MRFKIKLILVLSVILNFIIPIANLQGEIPPPFEDPKITADAIIADHTIVNLVRLNQVPDSAILNAKETLHIAYGHTSHGSQITEGMMDLPEFKENYVGTQAGPSNFTDGLYNWTDGPIPGNLDLDDYFVSGDLGNPDRVTWEARTRTYLETSGNEDVNVVMWSWCGQVDATEAEINTYLDLMGGLEEDYSAIDFVYMTGHANGGGEEGNVHIRNQQIRNHCITNGKILFDFYDIECYDPDGNYYGDKMVTDSCYYDSNNDSIRDANWALDWQGNNTDEWYDCGSAHSQPLNANQKAYAAWWLWATLAGWNQTIITPTPTPTPTPTTSTHPISPITSPIAISSSILGFIGLLSSTLVTIVLIRKRRK